MVGPISTQQVFFLLFFFGVGLDPTQPKAKVNYLQNMNWNGCRKWRLTKERLTQSRSLSHDQEVKLMFWAASLQGMVAEVDHRRKKKDVAEVRGRKKRWLFQVWWTPTGGFGDAWWNWWRKSEWEAIGSWRGSSERERRESCRRLTGKRRKMETGEWLVFCNFWIKFSSCSSHEIHPYL